MPPAPQPPKKSSNGCLIALGIVGGLAVLLVLVVGVGVWRFSETKEGKVIFGAIGEATRIAAEGQSAPGAAEVRALGCDQAMVLDTQRMSKLFEQFDASVPRRDDYSVMVICQVGLLGHSHPTCDEVARTYRAAVSAPPGPFLAHVKNQSSGGEVCSTLYAVDGKKLRDLPTGSTPRIPGGR
jgi:hypothetical protein